MGSVSEKIKELFGIDIRSLALFRIGLALVILLDLAIRLQDLQVHYTDSGVLPRDFLIDYNLSEWKISFHLISGIWQVQLLLFLIQMMIAISLLIGYRSRLSAFLSWILLLSVQARNPLLLQGGDDLLKLLLFWSLFLPIGGAWSLDQKLRPKEYPKQISSAGTAALLLQICFMYWFTAIFKSDPIWWKEGTAVWYALSIELFAKPLGLYFLQYPNLLKALTFFTYYLELFGTFFAFSPWRTGPLRFATAATFILFHLVGLNMTIELGIFSYVCTAAWLAFIPSWFWDHLLKMRWKCTTPWKAGRFSNLFAATVISYIFLWNVVSLKIDIPYFSPLPGQILQIEQMWNMFAPFPLKEDGWFVVASKLKNGAEVDILTGKPLTWEKPSLVSSRFKNDRWRSYLINLLLSENTEPYLSFYADYLFRKWNENHPEAENLQEFDIAFMMKTNEWVGPLRPPQPIYLWHLQSQEPQEESPQVSTN